MAICKKCRKSVGFFSGSSCDYSECSVEYCGDCDSLLKQCDMCEDIFCIQHLNKDMHGCEGEDEHIDEDEEEIPIYYSVGYGKDLKKNFYAEIDFSSYADVDCIDAIEDLMKEGYKYAFSSGDRVFFRQGGV